MQVPAVLNLLLLKKMYRPELGYWDLVTRGITPHHEDISDALRSLEGQAVVGAAFDELAKKRLGQITEKNPLKRKKKLADYLLYRGWESHLVYEKVGELIK